MSLWCIFPLIHNNINLESPSAADRLCRFETTAVLKANLLCYKTRNIYIQPAEICLPRVFFLSRHFSLNSNMIFFIRSSRAALDGAHTSTRFLLFLALKFLSGILLCRGETRSLLLFLENIYKFKKKKESIISKKSNFFKSYIMGEVILVDWEQKSIQ